VVGLVVVLAMLFLKARQRLLVALALVVAVVALMSFAPPRWMDRMETLADFETDGSAQRRLTAWWVGYQIALDHPITGGGFRVFWDPDTYSRYGAVTGRAAWRGEDGQDAHSIYFNLLGEHGWIGLGLFTALLLSTFLTLRRVRKQAARDPARRWIGSYAQMLQVSLLAYLVSGAFLSAAYFDLAYQLILIAVVLQRMATADVAAEVPARPAPLRPALRPRRPRALQSG
jgi:probable O-glycosylation ligase (exosortase A-associated)